MHQLAPESFPLCMRHSHAHLMEHHHLKHGARMQYGLFLKGVGLTLEEAMLFWRSEFGKSTPMTKRETTVVEGEQVPEGWVYVVYNPDVPSVLKIGKTFPDGIPSIMSSARRFGRAELADKFWFDRAYKAEQAVHTALSSYNLRTLGYADCGVELFKCNIEEVRGAIENERTVL